VTGARGARVGGRVGRLEAAARARSAALDPSPAVLVIYPDDWPPAELAEFEAAEAAGDAAARAAAVARATGVPAGPRTRLIAIRVRPDGPR